MSYELQLAAQAKAIAERVAEELVLIKEHLGQDFKAFLADVEAKKAAAAEAAKPIELTPEEAQAIVAARARILQQELGQSTARRIG
jgi:predicted anti-sigma-YlaC factor YlaD